MRVLFEEGRPLQPQVRMAADPTAKGAPPFGVLAKTQVATTNRHRLIYWPPLPKGLPEPTPEKPHIITDHVTLELWSGKSHPTWYRHDGSSASPDESQGWKLRQVDGQGFAHWFTMMVQHAVLDEQDSEVEANIRFPTSDVQRRFGEFMKHVNESGVATIQFPPLPHAGNYACCNFFVRTDERPMDYKGLVRFIEQLPLFTDVAVDDSCHFPSVTRGSSVTIAGTEVVVITACPGGTYADPCSIAASAVPGR